MKLLLDNKNSHKIGKVSQLVADTDVCQSIDFIQQLMKKIKSLDRKYEDLKKEGYADRNMINDRATIIT
ncbi:hypothetical protein DPMN_134388 [Dreissena polymorpha]|uniref:Uncharacterized protein n=1 Tax=Dreissena polymorpha TaxID=45954 RepID=A0A9D4JDS6_DREPO|nr:hypothetical protein DPMN_134388 [Dreissena polymorpha]